MDIKNYIKDLISTKSTDVTIMFVVNLVGKTDVKDFRITNDTIITEYFTEFEYNRMLSSIRENGYNVQVFFNELDFIEYIINKTTVETRNNILVFNLARNGKGLCKKSLIPSFCETLGIKATGSNAYMTCLGRHKFHYNSILLYNGVEAAKSWLYTKDGWLNGIEPPENLIVIAKPTYESASRGVRADSIFIYDNSKINQIKALSNEFEQDIIVQEFIKGYEVQVPLIMGNIPVVFEPVAITMNDTVAIDDKIITYDLAFSENYSFTNFNKVDSALSEKLKHEATLAAKCLGIENYGRIDFRIDTNGNYYIIDISTHPYLIDHSAFAFAFDQLGYEYKDIFASIIENSNKKIYLTNTLTNIVSH